MAIHRFKCSKELNDKIIQFSETHKFDTNDTLKEQVESWMKTDEMIDIIENEKTYLQRYDYSLNIDVKIFKSIKYYYIKKFLKSQEKKEYIPRIVTRLPIDIKHAIQADIIKNFEIDISFKPSETFETFKGSLNIIENESAIKKCYKNQYYQVKHKKYASTLNASI
jgi:hypothetical protein